MDSSDQLLPAGAKILLCTTPSGSKISPSLFVKFRLYKVVITICYWIIISVSKKKFFNSIWPVLKSISLREIIAFLHSFVSVRYLTIFILFCFALFSHFTLWILGWGRGVRGLQSTYNISVNAFARGKSIFVCRRCELINTWIHLRFSCHKEPKRSSRVQSNETSICRWPLVLFRSFWFPGRSPQAAQEWSREGLEEKAWHSK